MTFADVFVGRQHELEHLNRLLDLALSGKGQVCLVAGEAGAGKTALVREFSRRAQEAHQDLAAASGECNNLDGQGDPYLPFREILALLTGDVDTGLAQGSITPVTAGRLERMIVHSSQVLVEIAPDLINVVIPGARVVGMLGKAVASRAGWLQKLDRLAEKKPHESTLGEPSLQQDRVFEEYTAFLRRLAEGHPLVIFLDDLQWADAASIGLLFHLGRRIADARLLVIGAFRPDVVAYGRGGERHPLEPVLHEFLRYGGSAGIELASGSPSESRAFVDAILDAAPNRLDETFRQALSRHTEGHPLFTTELLRTMREAGDLFQGEEGRWAARAGIDWSAFPKRAEGVVGERIARLEETDRRILQVASLEGDAFTAEVVAAILGHDPREIVGALSGRLDREQGLVSGSGVRREGEQRLSSYTFRHHLVQQYLYESMDAAERSYLHEDMAKALGSVYGESEAIVGQLAWHYRLAGIADRAFDYSVRAGDQAGRVYANPDAVTHYSNAVGLLPSYQATPEELMHLFRRRGRALELSGQPQHALENYEEMESLARKREDVPLELASLTARAVLLAIPTVSHDPEKGRTLAEQALQLARRSGDQAEEAKILWSLLLIHRFTGHPSEAAAYGEQSLVHARHLGLREQLAYTLHDMSEVYWRLGETEKATEAVTEASQLWKELENLPMLANALTNVAFHSALDGELGRATQLAQEALQISRTIGNLSGVHFGQTILGLVQRERGELGDAISTLRDAVESGEKAGNTYAITGIRAEWGWTLACAGAIEEGLRQATQALAQAEEHFPSVRDWVAAIVARIHLMAGSPQAAGAVMPPAGLGPSDVHRDGSEVIGWASIFLAAGELALVQGDLDLADRYARKLIPRLREAGGRSYLPDALQIQGKALQARGDTDGARQVLQEARTVAESVGLRRVLWSILDDLAALEAAHGDPATSAHLRGEAREAAQYLADHISDPERRSGFEHIPRVAAVLAA
jgi:predicted ATPase